MAKNNSQKSRSNKTPSRQLFPGGDWLTIILGVAILSRVNGMGHHLGHTGLFLLMLALLARPISFLWRQPLQHRRAIGILAFAAAIAHAIYATRHVLEGNWVNISNLSIQHQWGIWAGIISLAAMTPAAATSFPSMQKKLGKLWRKIHLLTLPSLALASFHTVVLGTHYLGQIDASNLHIIRTYGIAIATILVFLMRQPIFWSVSKLKRIKYRYSDSVMPKRYSDSVVLKRVVLKRKG